MGPSIDVVIPLHQGENSIVAAIGSVMAQSTAPRSVVVVDDGSIDEGPDRVRRHFPTVEAVTQPNRGVGAARNAGVAASSSEWIAFLDADDVWLPWHLATVTSLIDAAPDAGMVAGAIAAVAPGGRPAAIDGGRPRRIDYFAAAARDITVVHSSAVAVRRQALDDVGGFGSMPNGEDLEMWARIALRYPVAVTSATTALYTVGTGVTATFRRDERARELPPPPTELAEISPSTAVVATALESGDHLPPADSLERYLDSRVARTMRTRLARGDVDGARQLGTLLTSRRRRENVGPVVQAHLPRAVVTTGRRAARSIRSLRPGSRPRR